MLRLKENIINLRDALLEVIISHEATYRDANEALELAKLFLSGKGLYLLDNMKAQEIAEVKGNPVADKKPQDYVDNLPMPHGAP